MIREALRLHRLFKNGFLADSPDFIQEKQPDGRYQLHLKSQQPAAIGAQQFVAVTRRVLLWQIDSYPIGGFTSLAEAKDVYVGLGVPWSSNINWTGNLSDYGLIIWPIAQNDPVWWSEITNGTWSGRLHLTAEYDAFTTSIIYVNTKAGLHGMFLDSTHSAGGTEYATPSAEPLAAGQTLLLHGDTTSVSGGATLFTSPVVGVGAMMQQNQPIHSPTDWVVAGDSNHVTDGIAGAAAYNAAFLANLINVPIRVTA